MSNYVEFIEWWKTTGVFMTSAEHAAARNAALQAGEEE